MFWYEFLIVVAALCVGTAIICMLFGFVDGNPCIFMVGLLCVVISIACFVGVGVIGHINTSTATEEVQMTVHERVEHQHRSANGGYSADYYLWVEDNQGERFKVGVTQQEYAQHDNGDIVTIAVTTTTLFDNETKSYDLKEENLK